MVYRLPFLVELEFGSVGFWGEGKIRIAGKNLSKERREPTTELLPNSVWVSIITGSRFPLCQHTITSHWNVSISELVTFSKSFYKITKIVRALWLAEKSVSMRVCKHGCGVKMFAFRALITQARIWKSFRVQNSTSLLYLPIPSSAETWKIITKKVCQFFFA